MSEKNRFFRKWAGKSLGVAVFFLVMFLCAALGAYGWNKDTDGQYADLVKNTLGRSQANRVIGGEIGADSATYSVDRLKYGRHAAFERLVFCINKSDSGDQSAAAEDACLPAPRAPRYGFALSADKKRAELCIAACQSKVDDAQLNSVADSKIIANVEQLKIYGLHGYFIAFKQPVKVVTYDLGDPGRIILDITPEK